MMRSPVAVLSEAYGAALHRDLPDVPSREKAEWMMKRQPDGDPMTDPRRPYEDEVEVWIFAETWPNTALGYGGMAGQAVTSAYTVIVACRMLDACCVYWGGSRLGRTGTYADGYEAATKMTTQKWKRSAAR